MRLGILGSGVVGTTLAAGWVAEGHSVTLGTRSPDDAKLVEWARDHGVVLATFGESAAFGELLVLAVKGTVVDSVINLAGPDAFSGKVLIDTNNPIADAPPVDGVLPYFTGPNESLAERIQAKLPEAKVVKAFNSVGAPAMVHPNFSGGTPTMFICGNDEEAKTTVSGLIEQFGWEVDDMGSLAAARAIEPLCMLWCIKGFTQNDWYHAFKMLR